MITLLLVGIIQSLMAFGMIATFIFSPVIVKVLVIAIAMIAMISYLLYAVFNYLIPTIKDIKKHIHIKKMEYDDEFDDDFDDEFFETENNETTKQEVAL